MTMSKTLLIAALLASCSAFAGNKAPNTLPKEHMTSAAGACHEVTNNETRLRWEALAVRNVGTTPAQVVCSPEMDASQDGTSMFGAVLTNYRLNNRGVTCVAQISSGGNGSASVSRTVMVGPGTSVRIYWNGEDMGTPLLLGGQAGFVCTLPPQMGLSWVWTTPRYTRMAN